MDCELAVNPNLAATLEELPFNECTFEKIYLFHTIEHIPERKFHKVFSEIWRVLTFGGLVYISYPEFSRCAMNYISNYRGMREFWKATIYGRQLYPTDFHCTLMDTPFFTQYLTEEGFSIKASFPEPIENFNSVVVAAKGVKPLTFEAVVGQSLFVERSTKC